MECSFVGQYFLQVLAKFVKDPDACNSEQDFSH